MGQILFNNSKVYALLELHADPNSKELRLLVIIIIIIINCAIYLPQRENCGVPSKKLFGSMVHHISLLKTLLKILHLCFCLHAALNVFISFTIRIDILLPINWDTFSFSCNTYLCSLHHNFYYIL